MSDVTFVDSLTGFFITGNLNTQSGTNYIYKTTNGGNNWQNIYSDNKDFARIIFINSMTGFVCGLHNNYNNNLIKTTNQGNSWFSLNTPSLLFLKDMSVLNEDTIWIVSDEPLEGGIFRTTNGGINWINQANQIPDKIYMVNKNLGFIRRDVGNYIGRTTDGGFNWDITTSDTVFNDIHFIDSLTGWRAFQNIKKTTNGGLTWFNQLLPNVISGIYTQHDILKFSILNKDTLFGVGGYVTYPNLSHKCIIYKTTNGGINWGYQIPDTSFNIYQLHFICFVDKMKGWSYVISNKGLRTFTGGADTTFYTFIKNGSIEVTKNFQLEQNYPNPFNSNSIIEYNIFDKGLVKLKIFDILGRELATLVNEFQNPGTYGIPVTLNLSSGIYFYQLEFRNTKNELQTEVKKMIYLK